MLMPTKPVPIGTHGKPVFVRVARKRRGFNTDMTQKRFRVGKGFLRRGYLKGSNARPQDINRPRRALLGWRSPVALRNRIFPLARSIAAGGLGVLDDFEDADISNYTKGAVIWTTPGAAAQEGNYGLRYIYADSGAKAFRTDLELTQGNIYTCQMKLVGDSIEEIDMAGILFGLQDTNNYYFAGFASVSTKLALYKYASGWNLIGEAAVSPALATWYLLTVGWASGGAMTLDWSGGAEQATGTDNTWASGGFGFQVVNEADEQNTVYWDYFVEL